jgi:F-type H+-transporting ATPase subunit epsilon
MATETKIQLEIVTPRGVVLSERVDEVVAPSVEGRFGVLPGHVPLLAALGTGIVRYRVGSDDTRVGVGAGFVEVNEDHTLLLTDRYTTKDEVDVLAVRERLKDVDQELEQWDGELRDPRRLELIEEEQWLAAQLELIGDPPVAKIMETIPRFDYADVIPQKKDDGEAQADEDEGKKAD